MSTRCWAFVSGSLYIIETNVGQDCSSMLAAFHVVHNVKIRATRCNTLQLWPVPHAHPFTSIHHICASQTLNVLKLPARHVTGALQMRQFSRCFKGINDRQLKCLGLQSQGVATLHENFLAVQTCCVSVLHPCPIGCRDCGFVGCPRISRAVVRGMNQFKYGCRLTRL